VRDDHDAYAIYVAETLALEGVRAGVEGANEPLGARIRKAKLEKIPTSSWSGTTTSKRPRWV